MTQCKVCSLLSDLDPTNANRFNDALLNRRISADTAADLIGRHLTPIAASTVKKHRKAKHLV